MTEPPRVAVFTDLRFRRVGERLFTDRSFIEFLNRSADRLGGMTLVGRFDEDVGARHPVGDLVTVAELPSYESIARPLAAIPGMMRAVRRFWRILDDVDLVWLWGPHPLSFPFALLARLRGRAVVLGARQHIVEYTERRHPGRPLLHAAARALELGHLGLARRYPIVVVGAPLATHYRRARAVIETTVSLVDEADILAPEAVLDPAAAGTVRVLTVGRLEAEKNPRLLADIAAALPDIANDDRAWRLTVCGEGPAATELADRAAALGVRDRVELLGYVPFGPKLIKLYRDAHVFLHVSWTEALPQVLFEAFAGATPVVATDVGGIRAGVGEAVLLVPPGDAGAAAEAITRIVRDQSLRNRLVTAGHRAVLSRTLDAETGRVVAFLSAQGLSQLHRV